jgi:YD repeat-containing protein
VAGSLGTFTTGWAYDAAGRVVTQTCPTGEEAVTAYNLRGLPVSVDSADIAPGYLTAATYNALGQVTSQNWGNTLATSYSYDAKNTRLLQMQLGSLLDLRYRYDKVGNILLLRQGAAHRPAPGRHGPLNVRNMSRHPRHRQLALLRVLRGPLPRHSINRAYSARTSAGGSRPSSERRVSR